MALKCREELVGKRFLSVSGFSKLKLGKVSEWGWRFGVIRAASHKDNTHKDLQVLVEYDDVEWHRREWISVYKEGLFHLFLVEQGLSWGDRTDPFATSQAQVLWPALTFVAMVSTVDVPLHLQPIEFLFDKELAFRDYKQLKQYKDWDPTIPGVKEYPEVKAAVRCWHEQQDGQRILLTTPSVLVGYRVEVYRAEGTTQWYTAVIIGYNEATRDLTVTDDTVLEEHNEDPALVQMRLIGDGVVESIMRGENVGITPRRSRSTVLQTQHQQTSRIIRGISGVNGNSTTGVTSRKSRAGKSTSLNDAASLGCASPEPSDKGSISKAVRKRKTEHETSKHRISSFSNNKEDLENKQSKKRNCCNRSSNKKKVLEETNNSKLREVKIRIQDCLQNSAQAEALGIICRRVFKEESAVSEVREEAKDLGSTSVEVQNSESVAICENDSTLDESSRSSSSSVQIVPEVNGADDNVQTCESIPTPEAVVSEIASEEDDCVIVAQRTILKIDERECSSHGDDDVPLSSSPFSRMELTESANVSLLRFPDDRSDSGVSSLRSGSGDERSGSRSSALSSSDEPQQSAQIQPTNRSPLFIPTNHSYSAPINSTSEPVRVWRDPSVLLESEPHVRHIHSVQHQSLLMSHPSTPAASGPPSTSAANHPSNLYPPVPPPPSLMSPHPLQPHLPPPGLYAHHLPEMLWKQRYPIPVGAHLLGPQGAAHPGEDILERERAYAQDRLLRDRQTQEARELEKQQHKERELKERERLERERQEREKLEREKHEKEREQERERQEKQRAEQAVHKHFEESFRRINQKSWNLKSLPPPQRHSTTEEERKRIDSDHQRHLVMRQDRYYSGTSQRPPPVTKAEYPPPAHSRVSTNKTAEKLSVHSTLPKAEVNMFGYPAYQPQTAFFLHEPKTKSDHHKQPMQSNTLVVTKSSNSVERERDTLPNPPPLMSELKSSVIVKHEGKPQHHLDPKVPITHSQSPKLRTTDMVGHYLPSGQTHKPSMYEYRSQTQSPHLTHAQSPHHHMEAQNLGKTGHQRPSPVQLSSPHHQRQSPHPHLQSHQSPDLRYRNVSDSSAMIYPSPGKSHLPASYSYMQQPVSTSSHHNLASTTSSNSKPKVSSPAPHHIYGKPSAGIGSGLPVVRAHEASSPANPIPLTSKPPLSSSVSPSPFQQMSQYHPPHQQATPPTTCLPPPAHSSRTSSIDSRPALYERLYTGGTVPGGLSAKPVPHHGTSPPTAASAPSSVSRAQMQYCVPGITHSSQSVGGPAVQTQPLDLGVSSNNKYDVGLSPKRKGTPVSSSGSMSMEVKKRRIEQPSISLQPHHLPVFSGNSQPQLARVSEPSPLIASAATTITTVVNTAAYRPPSANLISTPSQSPLTETLADVSVTAVTIASDFNKSTDSESNGSFITVNSGAPTVPSPIPANPQPAESPNTPLKTSSVTPSMIDSEKSNSPGPTKITTYPVRHLKKAWLQRHTGEDIEDTTGVTGGGSCVTLPMNIPSNLSTKDIPVASLHNIGSMAVNSINKVKSFASKAGRKTPHKDNASLNGHPSDSTKGEDSSSSDQDRGRKSPPKRKPPKVKRKKGGGTAKKITEEQRKRKNNQSVPASESGSDSEKESGSEKDSDSGASTTVATLKKPSSITATGKEPRKRGRRPKSSKNDKGEEPRPKKAKDETSVPQRDPFRKPPMGQLKKTGESFLQDGPCHEVAPKLAKCRECRWTPNQRSKNMPNIFCRFYAFRRLRYTKNGQLAIAGFSDPHKDALEEDLKLWLPSADNPPSDLDLDTSRILLKQVGDQFCDLLVQEKDAYSEHMSEDKVIAWKRVVQGVREMCDVCETTLFNFHWACGKCGFVVCLDCYKGRKNGTIRLWGEPSQKDRDDFSWLLCTNRQPHEQEKLMLTQIIAGDSLLKLGKLVHEMRELWNIEQYCGCSASKEVSQKSNGARKEIIKSILLGEANGIKKEIKDELDFKSLINGAPTKEEKTSPLSWLADVALSNEDKKDSLDGDDSSSDSGGEGKYSTLRDLLMQKNGNSVVSTTTTTPKSVKKTNVRLDTLDDVISSVIEDSVPKHSDIGVDVKSELKHFVRRYNWQCKGRIQLPIRIMTLTESKVLYPDTPHSWLCDGKLLRLCDPNHNGNYKIFMDQWKRGQPVLVSDVAKLLNRDLWNPESFARDFGDEKNDLINCMNGNLVPNQPMRKFWEGFDHFSKRLKDERGNPMLLKLKDWPPGEDFAEMLPSRFNDLMKVLPLSEYTHRSGKLNLASRLPDCFVRPDLGPKMYNAYGSALHPTKGTTNLHLDISDAVNVMVYVGIPKDGDSEEHIKEAFRAIDEAGCDILTRRRVRDKGELPGALWHIYNARDADKIRDLLNKIVVEKGGRLEPHHDPIHDQSCYLDGALRERLYKEYGVEGYAIVQCLGDAVFIPAGAPHQVRNLHNCIKVAEDFVSPENIAHCFHLTQEFRDLSDTHSNHEDKLQIKNIIYHAVKDSLSSLTAVLNKHLVKGDKDLIEHNGTTTGDGNNLNSNLDSTEPA
uniref:[histone H3]-dimethyl-L-lysine(9) demethylase n=2 Tax=Photinus pyralis TaxID=7054 RepID=A0A1Y1LQ77_PHOPY